MAETRRGRIAHATYVRVVGQMLTRDWFALDTCDVLTQFEIIGQLVSVHPNQFISPGWAVRVLLDKAMDDVIAMASKRKDVGSQRVASFLELRRQGKSVTAIAQEWGLSRECVSRTVSHKAVRLVTDRFLALTKFQLTERQEIPFQIGTKKQA